VPVAPEQNTWLFVSQNLGKIREWNKLLNPCGITLLSLSQVNWFQPIPETGNSFAENARQKVLALREKVSIPILADDSGLCVDALKGAPGVYSARYAGEGASDQENIDLLLKHMQGQKMRRAHFECNMCLSMHAGEFRHFTGICQGSLADYPQGKEGFGYDPIFIPEGYTTSFAQMPLEVKLPLSHRQKALTELLAFIG